MSEPAARHLLGADTPIGLTIIRELGEHGVPVLAVARSREGLGLYSKWITARYLRPRDDGSTIELLNRIAAERRPSSCWRSPSGIC